MANDTPILELSDLEPTRQKVSFEGGVYELLTVKDFGPRTHAWFSSRVGRINELVSKKDLTRKQETELEGLFAEFVERVVLGAPKGFSKQLSYLQKVQVFNFWSEGFTRAMGSLPSQNQSPSTGEK